MYIKYWWTTRYTPTRWQKATIFQNKTLPTKIKNYSVSKGGMFWQSLCQMLTNYHNSITTRKRNEICNRMCIQNFHHVATLPYDMETLDYRKNCLEPSMQYENDEAMKHVQKLLQDANKDFECTGFSRLVEWWERCNELHGDCWKLLTISFVWLLL